MKYLFENDDLLNVESVNVIPSFVQSFTEAALYVAEATEKDYNDLFMSIGINELAVFESTGMQIVYEDEEATSFKDKVVKFFKELWAKIKGFFENVLGKINQKVKEIKSNKIKLVPQDLDKIPEDKEFGEMFDYKFNFSTEKYCHNGQKMANEVSSKFESLVDSKKQYSNDEKGSVREQANKLKEDYSQKICSTISGLDVTDVKGMLKAIEKDVRKDNKKIKITKSYLKSNLKTLSNIAIADEFIKNLKKMYKESKKTIDEMIKNTRKYDDARTIVAPAEVTILKDIVSAMNHANSKIIDIEKRRMQEAYTVLVRVAKFCNKDKKGDKKATNESMDVVSRQLDLIESAFEW